MKAVEPKKKPQPTFTPWRLKLIGVFVLAAVIYLPSLMGAPIWDDGPLISGETFGGNTFHAALTHSFGNYFRPLTSLSFVLDASYSRSIPFFYHQTNILLHAITAVLVSILAFLITRRQLTGVLAGAFFATQPLQAGTTAWIGGRTDVLSSCFLAGFLVCILLAVQTGKRSWLVASLVTFLLAAFSKEQAVAIWPAAPLAVFVFGSRKWKDVGRLCIPFGIALILYLALWIHGAPLAHPGENSLLGTIALALRTAAFYGIGFLTPNRGSLVSFTLENYQGGVWMTVGAVLVAIYLFLTYRAWKWRRPVGWVAIVGLLVYIPISNFPTLPSMVVASYRFGQSGIAGACLLGMTAGYFLSRKMFAGFGILAANLAAGVVITWWGAHLWMTPMGYFSRVAKTDPHFIVGIQFYSQYLDAQGNHREAERVTSDTLAWVYDTRKWVELIEANPANGMSPEVRKRIRTNMGIPNYQTLGNFIGTNASYVARQGRMSEARRIAKVALVVGPRDPWVNYLYGNLLYPVDRRQAAHYWEAALKIAPQYSSCAVALAHDRMRDHRFEEARTLLEGALVSIDYSGNTWVDLADANIGLRNYARASDALDRAQSAMFPPKPEQIEKRRKQIELAKSGAKQ